MHVIFFTTSGCHLCEDAWEIINQVNQSNERLMDILKIDTMDIADSDSLVSQYGVRIPVLVNKATGGELSWPFEHHDYVDFINRGLAECS